MGWGAAAAETTHPLPGACVLVLATSVALGLGSSWRGFFFLSRDSLQNETFTVEFDFKNKIAK